MSERSVRLIKFHGFEFDTERLALYRDGEIVKVEKKSLEVLNVLIREPHKLISSQEIIDEVWHDNPLGVTTVHLSQSISKLRKAFAYYEPGVKYIETVKGNGYSFSVDVLSFKDVAFDPVTLVQETNDEDIRGPAGSTELRSPRSRKVQIVAAFGLLIGLMFVAAWILYPTTDEETEVRRIVEESQRYESLVLYRDPESFKEEDLDKYWTAEIDPGSNYDRRDIRAGVRKLIEDGRYYGSETKNEQFEFQSVEINANGDMAVVRTLEKWFIAEYRKDGSLLRNKYVGPYFVSYVVRKVDGRWLIEDSTTARANPPAPVLSAIQPVTEIVAGQQFFVDIAGSSFVPATVFLKVIGAGCPDTSPCTVPNSALRLHSDLAETKLSNVPLTLAPGEFTIYAQNGESSPSNALTFAVR